MEPSSSKFPQEDRYDVSSENAGVCVIFNQKHVKGYVSRDETLPHGRGKY